MKTGLSKTGLFQALFAISVLFAPLPLRADEPVRLQTFSTHSRLEISIDNSVPVRLKNTSHGFELTLNGVGLSDLGAPLGEEESWKAQYQGLSDSRIGNLKFREIQGALLVSGTWKYRTGPQGPAYPAMQCFDYRDKAPARFVLDFWPKAGPTVAEVRIKKERLRKKALAKKLVLEEKSYARRSLAMVQSAAPEGPALFCKRPLSEENDVFLPFRPVHVRPDFSRWISMTRPDADFPYYRPSAKDKDGDAAYVRLALDLNKEGKSALVIRTAGFFETEHPQSSYLPEMRLLKASAMVKLGLEKDAEDLLKSLTLSAKETPVAMQAGLFLAGKSYQRGEYLPAFEDFMYLIQHYGDHRLRWVFHLGAAETLFEMKQFERAEKEYEWVMENAPGDAARAEGGLRMGDLPLSRLQYDQALGTYFEGLHYFPKQAASFPAIHINHAETLYWLGQHIRAEKEFKAFLVKYPDFPEGWRAMFRLGEISGRRDSKEAQAESRKWFYTTINRFPFSPGATLARLRLVPCGDHGGMDPITQSRFFGGEAASFDGKGEVVMRDYVDFRSLAHVRALITSDANGQTVADAFSDLQATKNPRVKNLIGSVIGGYFRKSILAMISAGKGYQALTFYHEKSKLVPDSRGVNPDYLLKLSQTASDLGLGKLAGDLAARYQHDNLGHGSGDGRTPAKAPEDPPLLKSSEESFTMAKALWTSSGGSVSAKESAKIRDLLSKVIEESQYSYQREIILGLLDDKEGKTASALSHVMKAELLTTEKDFRLEAWLASLQSRAGDSSLALQLLRDLEKHQALMEHAKSKKPERLSVAAKLGVPPVPSRENLLFAQGRILEKQAHWGEAAVTYSRAVENGLGGNQAMFQYARSMMKIGTPGDHEKAVSMLQRLAGSKSDDFWKKLALETLADEKSKQVTNAAKEGGR